MSTFNTSDGLTLYYNDSGSGQLLLCLAGLTRCSRDFGFFAPYTRDIRLITMDYRGRGRSEYDPKYTNYNVLRESQDVIELLDHLGLETVSVLGTSRGGLIAMTLAATHPDRLNTVILNDIGPVVAPSGITRIMEYVGKSPASRTLDQAASALQAVMAPEFPDVPLERWRQQAEIQFRVTDTGLDLRYDDQLRTALLEQAASGEVPELWPLFDAVSKIPLGVIRGANSDVLDAATLAEMRARNPGLIVGEVPNRGHVPFLDEEEALNVIRQVLGANA